ncbi:MAG: protein kinase [Polyangiaceae bacterium]|nr:protein kinase [Polyangiaceae bacterium]
MSETMRTIGQVGERYDLLREIARGGMGVVYEGRHRATGRVVAVKCVPSDSQNVQLARKRLIQETKAVGFLRHRNIVEIHDAGIDPLYGPFLVMEMLDGRTLDGILASRRTLRLEEALQVARRVGEALIASHAEGVVHRDIKPSNIFVARGRSGVEEIKVIDYGIAGKAGSTFGGDAAARLTKAGDLLGTLDYVAPEQLTQVETVDPRSDQYALATVLYECLTGNAPSLSSRLAGPSTMLDLRKVVPGIDPLVADAIAIAMMPAVEDRFATMGEFLKALLGDARSALTSQDPGASMQLMTSAPVVSRRRHQRAPFITPVRLVRADGTHIDARSEDISEGGLLLVVPRAGDAAVPNEGASETVMVRFALPTTGRVVTASGVVRWIKGGRRCALGIEFSELAQDIRESIATYVKHFGVSRTEDRPGQGDPQQDKASEVRRREGWARLGEEVALHKVASRSN